jgi:hypothetical protein
MGAEPPLPRRHKLQHRRCRVALLGDPALQPALPLQRRETWRHRSDPCHQGRRPPPCAPRSARRSGPRTSARRTVARSAAPNALEQLPDPREQLVLGLSIQRRCRLVQDHQRRVPQERPRRAPLPRPPPVAASPAPSKALTGRVELKDCRPHALAAGRPRPAKHVHLSMLPRGQLWVVSLYPGRSCMSSEAGYVSLNGHHELRSVSWADARDASAIRGAILVCN